jgi:hypothetical protein
MLGFLAGQLVLGQLLIISQNRGHRLGFMIAMDRLFFFGSFPPIYGRLFKRVHLKGIDILFIKIQICFC